MIKQIFILFFLLISFQSLADGDPKISLENLEETCPQGECVDNLITELEGVQKMAEDEGCLPKEGASEDDITAFYESQLLDDACVGRMAKIQELQNLLTGIQAHFEGISQAHQGSDCSELYDENGELIDPALAAVLAETAPSCSEEKKKKVSEECGADLWCSAAATGSTMLRPISLAIGDDWIKSVMPKNCDPTNDNCLVHAATGFFKATLFFFEGMWDLLKMGGNYLKKQAIGAWNWLTGVEEKSSDAALALAEASEDEGVLSMLLDDPGKALGNAWNGLMGMMKEWLKNDVFCQKWDGVPHLKSSKCLEPYSDFDCLSCKTMVNGTCDLIGTFLAEVVPSFVTGGLINAVKFGASAGAKLAKSIKISDGVRKALQKSKLATMAKNAGRGVASFAKNNRVSKFVGAAASGISSRIGRFFKSAAQLRNSKALKVLNKLAEKSGVYRVASGGKKFVSFGWDKTKTAFKVILYPIDNPLTRKSFDLGMNLGRGKAAGGIRLSLVSKSSQTAMGEVDGKLIKVKEAQEQLTSALAQKAKGKAVDPMAYYDDIEKFTKARDEYLEVVKVKRADIFNDVVKSSRGKPDLKPIVDDLFPELKYSDDVSQSVNRFEIQRAEKDLANLIQKVDDPKSKRILMEQMNDLRSSPARTNRGIDGKRYFTSEEVKANAKLTLKQRRKKAFEIAGINKKELIPEKIKQLEKAVDDAHMIGMERGAGVYQYTPKEIGQKYRTLVKGGFSKEQANHLIRSGVAGDYADLLKVVDEGGDIIGHWRQYVRSNTDMFDLSKLDDYDSFLTKRKKDLQTLVKSKAIDPMDLDPKNFMVLRSQKTGREFFAIKHGSGNMQVFPVDGKRLGMGGLLGAKNAPVSEIVKKEGELLHILQKAGGKIDDVEAANLGSIRIGSNGVVEEIAEVLPNNLGQTKKIFGELTQQAKLIPENLQDEFRSFYKAHEKFIDAEMQAGRMRPSQFNPQNFIVGKDPLTDTKYFVFRSEKGPKDYLVFTGDGSKFGRRQGAVKTFGELDQKVLHFSDGTGIKLGETANGSYYSMIENAVSKSDLEKSKYFEGLLAQGEKSLSPEQYSKYQKFITTHQDSLTELGVLDDIDLNVLKPQNFRTVKTDGGRELFVIKKTPIEDSIVFSNDGKSLGLFKGMWGSLNEVGSKFGKRMDFSDGSTLRLWEIGGKRKYEFIDRSFIKPKDLIREVSKKYSVKTTNGALDENLMPFVRANSDLLSDLVKQRKLDVSDIAPDKVLRAVTPDGAEITVLQRSKNPQHFLFVPKDPSSLPGELAGKKVLNLDDLKAISPELKIKGGGELKFFEPVNGIDFSFVSPKSRIGYDVDKVLQNSKLSFKERISGIEGRLNRTLTDVEVKALDEVLEVGRGTGAYNYSLKEIRLVRDKLLKSGMKKDEVDFLIRSGYAARPPSRNIQTIPGFFADEIDSMTKMSFSEKRDLLRKTLKERWSKSADPKLRGLAGEGVDKLSDAQIDTIMDNLEAIHFVDYKHHGDELFQMAKGKKKLHQAGFYSKYDNTGGKPFENYKEVQRWLREDKPGLDLETFRKIHSGMMEGGVESLGKGAKGVFREVDVYGNVPRGYGLSDDIVREMDSNPYLSFLETGSDAKGKTGKIWYPNANYVKDEALARIADKNPDLVKDLKILRDTPSKIQEINGKISVIKSNKAGVVDQIAELKKRKVELEGVVVRSKSQVEELLGIEAKVKELEGQVAKWDDFIAPKIKPLNDEIANLRKAQNAVSNNKSGLSRQLVEDLTNERIEWFNKRRAALGEINTEAKLDEFVDLLAEFQRDMVSIHPLRNGNGRTTREFALYYPLMREGFPPPRILDPNNDLYRPLDAWKKEIKEGILSSNRLIDDMLIRAERGMPLERSPELVAPMPGERVTLRLHKGKKKGEVMYATAPEAEAINRRQYDFYVRKVLDENPDLSRSITSAPSETWQSIHAKARELYEENNLFNHYNSYGKNRIERVGVGVVGDDFKDLYGVSTYDNPALYQYKMQQWYKDDINWRGLATRKGGKVKTDDDIVDMFRSFDNQMTSNHILGARTADHNKIRKLAIDDIDSYQASLFKAEGETENLAYIAQAHSDATPPYYGRSIGYSTSKKEGVGKAFGMGAMQVGEWRKLDGEKIMDYLKPENQAKLSQRIVVGAKQSAKDVDLTRLKKVRDEFSYKYFRQEEVMGIGAADPDAIMFVRTMDDNGDVIKSFVRNPDRPYEIWVVKGDIKEGVIPKPEQLERVVDMRQINQ